jgi:hypothetical protein
VGSDYADWSTSTSGYGVPPTADLPKWQLSASIAGTFTVNVNAKFRALGFIVTSGAGLATVSVKGNVTNLEMTPAAYRSFNAVVGQYFVVPLTSMVPGTDIGINVVLTGIGVRLLALSDLPPWTVPNQQPQTIGSSIAALANLTVVAGVVGQQIWVFACSLTVDAAVAGTPLGLQDTSTFELHEFGTAVLNPASYISLSPEPLALGRGVMLHNYAPAAAQVPRGSLVYSQL